MSDDLKPGGGPISESLRAALGADAELSPSRLELERRRLGIAVAARARGRRRLGIGAAAVAVAGLAAAAVLALSIPPPPKEEPRTLAGLVRVGGASPLGAGRAVVPRSGGAVLAFEGGTALWLAAGSVVSSPDDGGLRLESGRVLARVARRPPAGPFVVGTPFGDVEVHGTVFSARLSSSSLTVDLYEGAVRLVRGGSALDLEPGESVRVRADGSIASRGRIDRAAVLADLLIAEKTAGLPGAALPRLAPSAVEPEAPALGPAPPAPIVEPAPAASPAPPPARRRPRRPEAPAQAGTGPAEIVGQPPAIETPAPLAEPPLAGIEVAPASPADEALFLDAYEKAQAGAPADARALLEKYFASYPEGRYWRRVAEILGEAP